MTMSEINGNRNAEELVLQLPNGMYFTIQTGTEGYDYTFYDQDFSDLDGGILTCNSDIMDVTKLLIAEDYEYGLDDCKLCDYDDFMDHIY